MISNCDGSSTALDHAADLYDFHVKFLLQVWGCLVPKNFIKLFRISSHIESSGISIIDTNENVTVGILKKCLQLNRASICLGFLSS